MHHTKLRVRQKRAFYGIQHPVTGLYARVTAEAPSTPQAFEDTAGNGDVVARHGHVRFEEWDLATWFTSAQQAEAAFARFIGAAPLEIVRREP